MERVSIDGLDVRVHRGGAGPPVLYLHSPLGEAGRTSFSEKLASHCDVLAPELPGFGGSEAPRWHRVEDAVFFLRCLLDHYEVPTVHAVGSSLGGWLAAEFAVWFPQRVRSAVLLDPVGIRVEGAPVTDIFMASRTAMVTQMFVEVPDPLDAALGEGVDASDGDVVLHLYKAFEATARLGWNPYFHDPQLRDRLGRSTVPTTIAWGDGDSVTSRPYAEAFAATTPGGKLVVLDGVGHVPAVEAPERAAQTVIDAIEVNS